MAQIALPKASPCTVYINLEPQKNTILGLSMARCLKFKHSNKFHRNNHSTQLTSFRHESPHCKRPGKLRSTLTGIVRLDLPKDDTSYFQIVNDLKLKLKYRIIVIMQLPYRSLVI